MVCHWYHPVHTSYSIQVVMVVMATVIWQLTVVKTPSGPSSKPAAVFVMLCKSCFRTLEIYVMIPYWALLSTSHKMLSLPQILPKLYGLLDHITQRRWYSLQPRLWKSQFCFRSHSELEGFGVTLYIDESNLPSTEYGASKHYQSCLVSYFFFEMRCKVQ
jgi:hypothetical protein